jgi:hypothetical protein
MHSASTNIGALIRTVTTDGKVQGYPPSLLEAGTTYGEAFTYDDAKSLTLTVSTGEATGTPTAQSVAVSLESSADGTTWVAVEDSTVTLTADEKGGEVDVNLTHLSTGHDRLRAKAVVGFTGGSTPSQVVAATVTLGGFSTLPA